MSNRRRQNHYEEDKYAPITLQSNILNTTQFRRIELTYPVALDTSLTIYPFGSTTYGGTYSMYYPEVLYAGLSYVNLLAYLNDTVNPDYVGRSREWVAMGQSFTHARLHAVEYSYVRTFVDPTRIGTLPPMSLALYADNNVNGMTSNIRNYFRDGSTYYQPVNAIKDIEFTKVDMPKEGIFGKISGGAITHLNQWLPIASTTPSYLWLGIGQRIFGTASVSNSFLTIGAVVVRLIFEFGIPQTS